MDKDIIIVATVVSMILLVFVVVFLLLLISNSNRKNKHRADLADMRLQMFQEVRIAEREATQSTMSDIARNLHDNLGQLLTAAKLGFIHRFEEDMESDEQLSSISGTLDSAIEEIGRLGHSLNTDMWEERTLFESIRESANHIGRMGLKKITIEQSEGEPQMEAEEKVILFRAFQEVLNNAMKHSNAKNINIRLSSDPLFISISDDGDGFKTDSKSQGSGLLNIKRRCDMVNVKVDLESSLGNGTIWNFTKKSEA